MWWTSFHELKLETLLAVECSTIRVAPKMSGIFRLAADRGVLEVRPVRKGIKLRYNYGSLVHEHISCNSSRFKTKGRRLTKNRIEMFLKWTNGNLEMTTVKSIV